MANPDGTATSETAAWTLSSLPNAEVLDRDSWWVTWARRTITFPAYFLLFAAMLLSAPVWLTLAAAVDLIRANHFALVRCLLFFTAYVGCEVIGIIGSGVIWLQGKLLAQDPIAYADANFRFQCWWARALLTSATRVFDLRFEAEASDEVLAGPLLLLMRHSSVGDTLLPAAYISNRYGIVLRYVLKRELLWDPCLDLVGNRLPNYFARRGSHDSQREVRAIQRLSQDLGPLDGVLIYPEGTRFTPQKRAAILARLEQSRPLEVVERARSLQCVLPPRPGGTLGLLDQAPDVDVVFCAHTGFEAAGSFAELWRGGLVHATVRVCFWRIPAARIPRDHTARNAWLHAQWQRVDAWVAAHQATTKAR